MKKISIFIKDLRPGSNFFSIPISILICILVIGIYTLEDRDIFTPLRIFRAIELKSLDIRFQLRGKRDPGDEIVIVGIDEKSINRIGRYPWPRVYVARFIEKIANAGARVLVLDVMYSEPQNAEVLMALDSLTRKYNESSLWHYLLGRVEKEQFLSALEEEKKRFDEDNVLKDALKKAVIDNGMDIVSAIRFIDAGEEKQTSFTGKALSDVGIELLRESAYFPVLVGDEEKTKTMDTDNGLTVLANENRMEIMNNLLVDYPPKKAVGVVNLIDPFAEYITYQGFVDTNMDYSGIVRSEYMAIQFQDEFYPPLGVQVARVYKGLEYGDLKLWLTKKLLFKETKIPIDSWNRMTINYCGPAYTFKHYSFCDVIDGKISPDAFNKKIVFLGATAQDLGDTIATPFSSQTPGVEKHATVVENILHEKFVVRGKSEVNYDILAILCISLAMGIFLPLLPSIWGGVASASLWSIYICYYVHYIRFVNDGTWLNITYPSLTLIMCFSSITLYRFITEEKRRKVVKSAFENFIDKKVVHKLLKEPDKIRLGGEEKEITIFFSDIAKFSTISERMLPTDLIEFLNAYLSEMTNIILDHEGFLDKYVGDCICAAFGVPLSQPDHAVRACLAAIDNQKKLLELNKIFIEQGKPDIKVRIGLNSGCALVGYVGSKNRLSYTMIGDEVNLGSRLEGANKHYGTNIMISERTFELAGDYIEARELDLIRVVGKEKPVKVYELIGKKGEIQNSKRELLELYEEGLKAYWNREWEKATFLFKDALDKDPDDGPSQTYMNRCMIYTQKEPLKNWDGVHILETK